MAKKSIWLKRSFFGPMVIFYLVLLLFFGIMQQSKLPAAPLIGMQISSIFITYFFSFLYSKKSIAVTCTIVFFFQLICSFGLRYFNFEYFHDPLGFKPADALAYHEVACRFYRYSLRDFVMFMDSMEFMLDDRGMNYITYFIYKIAGSPDKGLNLAVFTNVCCITMSAFLAFKLTNVYVETKYAQFIAFIWGTQLYATYTAATGLKENFMVLFIVASLYYIAILYNEFTWKNLFMAIFFALFALFFRMAVFYMLISCILFVAAMRFPTLRKYLYVLLAGAVFLTWFYYQRTFDEMTAMRRGADAMDYETYQGLVEGKMNQVGVFASIVSYLSALIGPLPNIVASGDKANYITLFSFSSFCKSFYAFFFLYGIYISIKEKNYSIIAILIFWFLDIFMLIVTFYTLHDRYHWPHVPIVLTMSAWGAVQWFNHKHPSLLQRTYLIIVLIIIISFNFR